MKEAILYLSTLFWQLQKKGDVVMLDELKCIMLLSIEVGIQPLASNQSKIAANFSHFSFAKDVNLLKELKREEILCKLSNISCATNIKMFNILGQFAYNSAFIV